MKPFKAPLAALATVLIIFPSFCFVKVGFDITTWSEEARALCAIYSLMFGAVVFCVVKGL
jgi:TRAP-type C4-dicarboxylate transport system permease small subunit